MQKQEKGDETMKYENLTQYVVEHMDEMIVCFDQNGVVTYGNPAAGVRLEYGEELIGTHISEIFPNAFWVADPGFGTDVEFNEENYELMAYRYNKTCFPIDAKFIDTKDGNYLCLSKDITRRAFLEKRIKQVEQDAEDAMKVKSEFVANVTHELRTPVNGLLGNTRELISRLQDEECLRILDIHRCSAGIRIVCASTQGQTVNRNCRHRHGSTLTTRCNLNAHIVDALVRTAPRYIPNGI